MGLFNAANQWRNLLMFIPGMMMQAALPMMSFLRRWKARRCNASRTALCRFPTRPIVPLASACCHASTSLARTA